MQKNKEVAFENNAPFISHISKTNGDKIDNAEDLDVLLPIYSLLEYSKNYIKTTGSLWNYCRDEPSNPLFLILNLLNIKQVLQEILIILMFMKLVMMKKKIGKNETEVAIPLKYLSNFWRNLNIPLINCEVKLILTWAKNCVLADMTEVNAGNSNDPSAIVTPTKLEIEITDTKLYVPVVTLSKENDTKLLAQL